ncbi:LAME_0C05182g1_1 [Lachancea meyersii CBS 8951]|uniref:LAME_0C05182g1_1 n=1 Tax=Lachancea meyersii CBS 8951 TaxID=1266667 RepID=A0A1G4J260_9SACH|nr:LAME_0C05182g1_1 [Lachancea meyersii CBS 8951]
MRLLGANLGSLRAFASRRSVTYLHSGNRVRGLKRDPSEYLRLPSGLLYTEVEPSKYHETVRSQLNLQSHGITLSDDVILQCLTHKSFAHGGKPYNEKLALVGAQYLKFLASVFSLKLPVPLSPVAAQNTQKPINGLNFTNLGSQGSKLLISKKTTAEVIKKRQLDSFVFWKKRDPIQSAAYNGETAIYASVLNALVGGILLTNGPEKASQYIQSELLDSSKDASLVCVASSHNA